MLNNIVSVFLIMISFISVNSIAAGPVDWQIGLQPAVTPVMEEFHWFHHKLLWMCFGVSGFVLALIIYVCIRYNKKCNPIPSKTSHHTMLEIIWTAVPVIIIAVMAIPSFRILYIANVVEDSEMTLKVVGRQWYWQYEYPDYEISFDSYIIPDNKLEKGQLRLLDVDNRIILPIDTKIRILTTGGDVIHSWAMPAFGVKIDAVPGRTNETWIKITKPGVYYGQCSELCGSGHGFMPISVEAVTKDDFTAWVQTAKEKHQK